MALAAGKQQRRMTKAERVEARLNPEQKQRIAYAASLRGTSISDFIVSSADDAAARAIEHHDVLTLTNRNREVFVKALMRPPTPSRRMKTAAQRYRRRVRSL